MRRLTILVFLAAAGSALAADPPDTTVVRRGGLDALLDLQVDDARPGTLAGRVTNRAELEIAGIVVLVRHAWVWDYRGGERPDTASSTETVRVAGPLAPGASAAFSSRAERPGDAPADARYVGRARVLEAVELHPLDIE